MSMFLRKRASRVGIGVLAGLCLAAGVTVAAAQSSSSSVAAQVDHQLCYTAKGTFKIPAGGVRLLNQFMPNGFIPKIGTTAALHCNPVVKYTPDKTYDITNPDAHLVCFPMSANPQPTYKVLVTNQFGQATLTTGQPKQFCVPSWTGLTAPPKGQPTTPPGLSHFTCYPVAVVDGAYKPPVISLKDVFAGPEPVDINPVPTMLCLPTEKFLIKTKKDFPIVNPDLHLLCYPVSKTPVKPTVWDENQFGTVRVSVKATKTLCLPSTKQIVQTQ